MLEAVKENLERAYGQLGDDGFITTSAAQSLVDDIDIPVVTPGSGEPPVLPIPTILASDITAMGTFQSIILSWNIVYDYWLAYFEIFRSQTSFVGDATAIATTPDHVYEDLDVVAGETYWYWIRIVQKAEAGGDMGVLPATGKEATVNEDPSVILDLLIGNITESHLFQTLSDRIDLIDSTGPGSVTARIEAARQAEEALRISGDSALHDVDMEIQADIDELTTRVDTAEGNITANASQISYLATLIDELEGGGEYGAEAILALEARVTVTEQDNIAQSAAITALGSRVTIAEGQITAHSDSITAIESDIGVLQGETYNLNTDSIAHAQAIEVLETTVEQQGNDLSAVAAQTTQLSTTVGGHTTTIEEHAESINGLEGQYVVRIDANGKIIGFGLSTGDGETSEFAIRADKFYIVLPTGDGTEEIIPFIVGNVNGISTVGIDGDLVVDGTILARHISSISLSVIRAVVSQLSAISANLGAITAGSINIGNGTCIISSTGQVTFNAPTLQSTNFVAGSTGWQLTRTGGLDITNINCVGTANIRNANITTAKIGDAQVTTLKIGADQVTVPACGLYAGARALTRGVWTSTLASLVIDAGTGSTYIDLAQMCVSYVLVVVNSTAYDVTFTHMYRVTRAENGTAKQSNNFPVRIPAGATWSIPMSFVHSDVPLTGTNSLALQILWSDNVITGLTCTAYESTLFWTGSKR